uniref:Uncharacterized protein n=1 Tax=Tanacetum cinerariifolium TaxID=118510 RepID=A0A699HA17_TANCI|nr:hypothetical protein [Tanacetum cinerariifolium]
MELSRSLKVDRKCFGYSESTWPYKSLPNAKNRLKTHASASTEYQYTLEDLSSFKSFKWNVLDIEPLFQSVHERSTLG